MEIERKWLIREENIPFHLDEFPRVHIEQRYISYYPTIRIREMDKGEKYILTVKTRATDGTDTDIARNEYETSLTQQEYENLVERTEGNAILKTRYFLPLETGHTGEVDIFEDAFRGLAYLEIEFSSVEEANRYSAPAWVEREVTRMPDYKNAALAKHGLPADFR